MRAWVRLPINILDRCASCTTAMPARAARPMRRRRPAPWGRRHCRATPGRSTNPIHTRPTTGACLVCHTPPHGVAPGKSRCGFGNPPPHPLLLLRPPNNNSTCDQHKPFRATTTHRRGPLLRVAAASPLGGRPALRLLLHELRGRHEDLAVDVLLTLRRKLLQGVWWKAAVAYRLLQFAGKAVFTRGPMPLPAAARPAPLPPHIPRVSLTSPAPPPPPGAAMHCHALPHASSHPMAGPSLPGCLPPSLPHLYPRQRLVEAQHGGQHADQQRVTHSRVLLAQPARPGRGGGGGQEGMQSPTAAAAARAGGWEGGWRRAEGRVSNAV